MAQISQCQSKPTVIYDGQCRFCLRRIDEIKRLDSKEQLHFMPWLEALAEHNYPEIAGRKLDDGILLVDTDRSIYVAADAIHQIARRLPVIRTIAWLYKLPVVNGICKIAYKVVAINRRRLGQVCEEGACHID